MLYLLGLILLLCILIYIIYNRYKSVEEGFLHPHYPHQPWYWYNFPTRYYQPTRNMIYDLRGPVYYSHYGRPRRLVKRYPRKYFYSYFYPSYYYNYDYRYDADGNLYKVKEEKVKNVPQPDE